MTPLHRGYAKFGDKNVQPPENYANRFGLYIDDYVECIKQAGKIWSCPVIDLFNDSGLYPLNESYYKYFSNSKVILERLNNTEISYQIEDIDRSLGEWVRNALSVSYDNGFGKVKVGVTSIMDAYKLLYRDTESPYYIKEGESTSLFNIYNAHTQVLSNDKKDIVNKFEKCGLIGRILGITDF